MTDFSNEKERQRVVDLIKKMNFDEAHRLLTLRKPGVGYYSRALAPELGIRAEGKYLMHLSREIYQVINGKIEQPPGIVTPTPPKNPLACDGCAGIGDTPRLLRWAKVARGEALRIQVHNANRPATLAWLTPELILNEWYMPWAVDTSLRFELVESQPDIDVIYRPIDGPGRVRGMAFLPNQSIEFMESGGDLSGTVVIDSIDRWTNKEEVHETGEHEGGHTLGFPHTLSPSDVMYAYGLGKRRPHSVNDKKAKTTRYPLQGAKAA